MAIKTLNRAKLNGRTVLVRVDFNVPLAGKKIKNNFKIVANLELIEFLIKERAKIVLVSHLGEPIVSARGSVKNKNAFSLAPVARELSKLLKRKVLWLSAPIGSDKLAKEVKVLKAGQVTLLENLRFYAGETKNDSRFARDLSDLADLYVNNAFAVSHRQHASVAAIKKYLPSFAGPLLIEEVKNLQKILKPKKPLVAVVGGAKIETKVALLKNLSRRANWVLVGGALANNFLAAKRLPIGKSLATPAGIKLAKKLSSRKIIVPSDVVVLTKEGRSSWRQVKEVKKSDVIVDIGPETMKLFASYIKKAQTIIWNGPMGKYEDERARYGTLFVARAIASRASGPAFGLAGGGETIDALKLTKMEADMDWVSTGGGASLSYLAGEPMPGLKGLI